jgi:hypothetical protein
MRHRSTPGSAPHYLYLLSYEECGDVTQARSSHEMICCRHVTSSLTREWVCHLQLLLGIASAVTLRSESRGTHDHILLSQIRDSPNLEGQVPVFISPRNRVARLYPQALGSLAVASYDSLGYGGGFRPRFHRVVMKNFIYCDMTPEGRNSGARGDVHCKTKAG